MDVSDTLRHAAAPIDVTLSGYFRADVASTRTPAVPSTVSTLHFMTLTLGLGQSRRFHTVVRSRCPFPISP